MASRQINYRITEGPVSEIIHGRGTSLVNEHTASAGEMLAAFAEEMLCHNVGTKTAADFAECSTLRLFRQNPWIAVLLISHAGKTDRKVNVTPSSAELLPTTL